MKITIEIDVAPTELREFLGLPDVSGLQEDVIEAVRAKMAAGVSGLDPVSLLKTWVPQGLASVGEWQSMLRRAMQAAQEGGASPAEETEPAKRPARKARRR